MIDYFINIDSLSFFLFKIAHVHVTYGIKRQPNSLWWTLSAASWFKALRSIYIFWENPRFKENDMATWSLRETTFRILGILVHKSKRHLNLQTCFYD